MMQEAADRTVTWQSQWHVKNQHGLHENVLLGLEVEERSEEEMKEDARGVTCLMEEARWSLCPHIQRLEVEHQFWTAGRSAERRKR